MGLIKRLVNGLFGELGEDQGSKEGSWPTGEPLMHGDDRAVVLLDLLFPQSQARDKGHFEMAFNHE